MSSKTEAITVRGLEPGTKRKLRIIAAARGHSMEEEARRIRIKAKNETRAKRLNLAEQIAAIVDPIGGFELDIPPRSRPGNPQSFEDQAEK